MAVTLVGTITPTGSGGSGGFTDALALRVGYLLPDSNAVPADAILAALSGIYPDITASPADAIKAGISGYTDANPTPADSKAISTTTWGASQTSTGTATNAANALGAKDGVFCTMTTQTASTLTVTIGTPIPTGTSYVLQIYFKTAAATVQQAGTLTVTYSLNGGAAVSVFSNALNTSNDYSTTPLTVTLGSKPTSLTVTFSETGAVTGNPTMSIDAVGVLVASATL